jgi:hypothetical protein
MLSLRRNRGKKFSMDPGLGWGDAALFEKLET